MIVIDTNVMIHLLSDPDGSGAAKLLRNDPVWAAPAIILSELRNVLVGFVRNGLIEKPDSFSMYQDALAILQDRVARVDGNSVIEAAIECRLTAYDAEFLVLAEALGVALYTEDEALLKAAPKRASRIV